MFVIKIVEKPYHIHFQLMLGDILQQLHRHRRHRCHIIQDRFALIRDDVNSTNSPLTFNCC